MTEDPVDQLLKDLDVALSVEPSPSVTAGVRRQIDTYERSAVARFRPWLAAAVIVAVAVASYAVWPRSQSETAVDERLASATTTPAPIAASAPTLPGPVEVEGSTLDTPASDEPPARPTRRSSVGAPPRVAVVALDNEPEVIVSPAVRLGFEQLRAAVASGRITAESFGNTAVNLELTVVVPIAVAVLPLTLDGFPADYPTAPGGSGAEPTFPHTFSNDRLQFVPVATPMSFARSNL